VWQVFYMTYAEIAETGLPQERCNPPRFVAGPMSFDAARRMVDDKGFGYCMKPWNAT
jgi:hypothetical protein